MCNAMAFFRNIHPTVMIFTPTLLLTADNCIGRFDVSCIEDDAQQMLELMCQDMLNVKLKSGMPNFHQRRLANFYCEWEGVECHVELTNFTVYKIDIKWHANHLPACQMFIEFLPKITSWFSAENGKSFGTLDISKLPTILIYFSIMNNAYTGTIDINSLPDEIISCNLSGNKFSGKLNIMHLPASLTALFLDESHFLSPMHLRTCYGDIVRINGIIFMEKLQKGEENEMYRIELREPQDA